MSCEVSIVIVSYKRPHLLKWALLSLAKQAIPFSFEVLVINDGIKDETEEVCNQYKEKLNINYLFTGERNSTEETKWRVPGFALNIGAKQVTGQVMILADAEMFHLNDTITQLTQPVLDNPKLLSIPIVRDDTDSSFLNYVINHEGSFDPNSYDNYPALNRCLPFFMAVNRDEFISIGGYDEDFIGIGYDDNDLINRMLANGCGYYQTGGKTIHLYHPRQDIFDPTNEGHAALLYNCDLYLARKGSIVRNQNREWGKL